MLVLDPDDLADALWLADSSPDDPEALFVDLTEPLAADLRGRTIRAVRCSARVVVGLAEGPVAAVNRALAEAFTFSLVVGPADQPTLVAVADPVAAAAGVAQIVRSRPIATSALAVLMQQTGMLPVWEGLVAESATYSTLLAGPEFAGWLAAAPARPLAPDGDEPVLVTRAGDRLLLELNRPARRNAYGHALRDALLSALQIAVADPSVTVELTGRGPAFCSGGDLAEFGTAPDAARAHLIRLRQSAGAVLHDLAPRVTAYLHGACIGAGIELPAFVGRVVAAPDTRIALPEVAMGLVPGAGGTVSIVHRIGRWRTAWLGLTGAVIGPELAADWGLVDEIRG